MKISPSNEYTPTTEQVRSGYAEDPVGEYHDPVNASANQRAAGRAFDRWLSEVKREAAEKAWEEGFDAHEKDWDHHNQAGWGDEDCLADATTNPYGREERHE